MKQSTLFLVLTWFTVITLIAMTYPIFLEHNGFDIARFSREISLNSASKFLGADLSLMGLCFVPFMYFEGKRIGLKRWWLPLIGIFLVGLAVIVPWFLYLRAKEVEKNR
jgi:Terpene cyclase DEP1